MIYKKEVKIRKGKCWLKSFRVGRTLSPFHYFQFWWDRSDRRQGNERHLDVPTAKSYLVLFDHSCSLASYQPYFFRRLLLPRFRSLQMSLLNLRRFTLACFSSMSRFQGMASLLLTVSVMLWPTPTQFTVICKLDEVAVLA